MKDNLISVMLIFTMLLIGFTAIGVAAFGRFIFGYLLGIVASIITLSAYIWWEHRQGYTV